MITTGAADAALFVCRCKYLFIVFLCVLSGDILLSKGSPSADHEEGKVNKYTAVHIK